MRMLNVAAFAVSGYACTEGRKFKPFNPLLGETYEANYPDKGLRFISEKVLVQSISYFLFLNETTVKCLSFKPIDIGKSSSLDSCMLL